MIDEVWKDFFTDHQTKRVMNSSEVWRNYSQAEVARDCLREKRALEERLDSENQILSELQEFREKIASNPKLKTYLKKVASQLEANPDLRVGVDPNFLRGLELLDLED